jgi:hypothetical protein
LGATSLPAIAAALRLIRKAFLGEELLLAAGENELNSTVFTGENLVFQRLLPRVARGSLDATKGP